MPNAVSSHIPWKLLDLMVRRLKTIQRSAGYQTQPKVTTDPRVADTDLTGSLLLVVPGQIKPSDVRAGPAWTMVQTIDIYGQHPVGTGEPWEECFKLMQDTLYCVTTYFSSLATALGRGGAVDLGELTMSLVPLDDTGLTVFHIPVDVAWNVQASSF